MGGEEEEEEEEVEEVMRVCYDKACHVKSCHDTSVWIATCPWWFMKELPGALGGGRGSGVIWHVISCHVML